MKTERRLPEGRRIYLQKNLESIADRAGLRRAQMEDATLEARVTRCDADRNLLVELSGGLKGVIPRSEAATGAETGMVRDIAVISLVGRPVCFKVLDAEAPLPLLSRRLAQVEALTYLMEAEPGEILPFTVTHLEDFGAFVDVGCGIVSLIGIENISISRISHPSDRFCVGQEGFAAVLAVDRVQKRISLTHRELLGTWEQNAAHFEAGETVSGIVRGVEDYGAFIELAPNLSGLTERREGLKEGDGVSVYIKSINPERMKVKLLVIDVFEKAPPALPGYFITGGRLESWRYSPEFCEKVVAERVFGAI